MRYTRGLEAKGDMWGRLAELKIEKVAVQKDIPTKQLEDEEIAGWGRAQLRRELVGIHHRWESGRSEEEDQKKRPFLDSDEWGGDRRRIRSIRDQLSFGFPNSTVGNGEITELDGQTIRRTMELVGNLESIRSATIGDG